MKKAIYLLAFLFVISTGSKANNIEVKNIAITGQNVAQSYSLVKFDLSWENSWRLNVGPANWDAAWVFIKFRVNGGSWRHASLNYVNGTADGHITPAGATIRTEKNPGLTQGQGVFVHRSVDGSGDVNYENMQLRWNYGADFVGDNDLVDVQVFAIEMVYVPQGEFSLGGGDGFEISKFYAYPFKFQSYTVVSEAAITVGQSNGNLFYDGGSFTSFPGDQAGPIPAAFPKGFKSFYCMKYEASQEQWVSYFNTLTEVQKTARDVTDADHKNSDAVVLRNGVSWPGIGTATTTLPNVPINFLTGDDSNSYLDWAALRPFTEMEYEKASRGPLPPVAGGFAWGTSDLATVSYSLSNAGTDNENISNPGSGVGNVTYNTTNASIEGPLRCGIYSSSAVIKNREETGGSYYGIMELSGNLDESVVSAGLAEGRAYTGLHGDGSLAANGNSNVANWTKNTGSRGGSFGFARAFLRTSNRAIAGIAFSDRQTFSISRGVRTVN